MSIKIAAMVAILAGGAAWLAYAAGERAGIAQRDLQNAEKLAEYRSREVELVDELNKAGAKIKVVYRDRIKVIREAAGDDCLDRVVPGDIVEQLR